MSTLADICAEKGVDWRDNIDQIAIEDAYAASKGVNLNFARPKPASIGADPEANPIPGEEKKAPGPDEGEESQQ
jgi:hypothetical protein